MGTCGSKNATETSVPLPDNHTVEEDPALARKESLVRPIVRTRNDYVYNSFSLGYKQLGVGLNGAVRAVQHKVTGISYGKWPIIT